MPETAERTDALEAVRRALVHWGFTAQIEGEAIRLSGMVNHPDYYVAIAPVPPPVTPQEARRRQIVNNLIASDGVVKKIEQDTERCVLHFNAFNAICADRIKNRALFQGEDVTWGPKFTGEVTL